MEASSFLSQFSRNLIKCVIEGTVPMDDQDRSVLLIKFQTIIRKELEALF